VPTQITAANPSLRFGEISKLLAVQWKEMDTARKKVSVDVFAAIDMSVHAGVTLFSHHVVRCVCVQEWQQHDRDKDEQAECAAVNDTSQIS
jgi:nitrogen regulatory protein PII-like uncharacterized protein